jgi:putative transcriptional regulator
MKMDVYKSIMTGLNEAVGYEKGAVKARKIKCTVNPVPDFSAQEIKSVRNNLQMTQATFAVVMGVSKKTVEAWEVGTNRPIGTARRMLSMLQTDPALPIKYNIVSK